jgi:hypothetical protein
VAREASGTSKSTFGRPGEVKKGGAFARLRTRHGTVATAAPSAWPASVLDQSLALKRRSILTDERPPGRNRFSEREPFARRCRRSDG